MNTSAAEARRRALTQLTKWSTPTETCDSAQLIISELVTNALRHTRSETVGCELRLAGTLLRVAVASEGGGPRQAARQPRGEDEDGRGLLLVGALAEGWGVRTSGSGRGHVVWADLTMEGAPL